MSFLRRLKHRLRRLLWTWQAYRLPSSRLLRCFSRLHPQAVFAQIGSNDGEQLDPLRKQILRRQWRGVMVEPVPYVFQRLRHNYGHLQHRIALENSAIADQPGELPFYHLAPVADHQAEGLPRWYDALGSFRREVVLKHVEFIPDIAERLVTTAVPCISFDQLCDKHALYPIDLLHMDTEGYDFEILKSIDWTRHRPRLVIYEHLHLAPVERDECSAFLNKQGYGLIQETMDTWCVNLRPEDARQAELIELFQRLSGRAA